MVVILLIIWTIENRLLESTVEAELRDHIEDVSHRETAQIQHKLNELRHFARSLASNDLIVNSLIDVEGRDTYIPIFFRSLSAPLSEQASVSLLDFTGRGIATSASDRVMPPVSPDMVAEGAFFIDSHRLLIVEPILLSGLAEGAIALNYPASSFDKLFGKPSPPHSLFVTGYGDLIVYSTNPSIATVDSLNSESPFAGWLQVRSSIPQSNLSVTIGSSVDDALKPMEAIQSVRMIGLVVLLSASIGLLLLSVLIVSRPLNRLTEIISTIKSIEDLNRPLSTKGPREITKIAVTFNQMAGWLKATTVSRNYMDSILESIIEGVVTIDDKGLITTFNSSAINLFGYDSEEVVGCNVSILMQESERIEHDAYIDKANLHASRVIAQNRDLQGRRKDGSLFPMELTVTPIQEGDKHGFVGTIRDITERKISEQKLEERSLELKRINKELEHMALTDSLTGLGNRNLFNDRLANLIASCKRNNNRFSLLMMDLDKFKAVNDTCGHEAGDAVLREVGKRLAKTGRDADRFYRLGGDEFAGLINTGVDEKGITVLCQRIIEAFKTPVEFNSTPLDIGISIGFVIYPEDSEGSEELMHLADTAMYLAKRNGLGFSSSTTDTN